MNRDSQAYLSRTGISNIENIRFEKIHNKFNVLTNQTTTPTTNSGTQSVYMVNNELYFNNNKLTNGGSITGGTGTISDSPFTITVGTITQKTPAPLQMQNQAISSVSSGQITTITSTKGTITDFYSTSATITNIAPDTIQMTGATRTINNLDGINFVGLNPYITGLNNLNLSGNLNATLSTIGTLSVTLATITNLNSSTITTNKLNLNEISLTNATITNLYGTNIHLSGAGSKLDGVDDATITDLYSTYVSTNELYGRNLQPDGRHSVIIPNQNLLESPEIRVANSGGTGKLYAQEVYIGTYGGFNTYLPTYIVAQIGTHSNETLQNLWVYPQPIYYKQLELNGGSSPYVDSGLKTDVLIIDKYADIETLYCHQFTTASAGSSVFDFFDTAGSLLWNAGEAAIKFKLAQKAMKFGLTVVAAVAATSIAGNIIYNVIQDNTTPNYFNMADELGCYNGTTTRYTILEPPIGAPDNTNNLFSFGMNPVVGGGRLASQGYIQTENAQGLGEGPDAEIIWYAMTHGHDTQNSISFKQYTSIANWESVAKQGINAGVYRTGANMYNRRLMSIDDDNDVPRLRFNGGSNILAYKSEIDAIDYWEINSGNLQPNANSTVQGLVQINSGAVNTYRDLYLVNSNLNFTSSTKARIAYNDTAKTLTFKHGDGAGEFIFLDESNVAQFKIDSANNRLEIPEYDLFFQYSFDQKINKVGSTNLIFEMNSQPILTLKNPPSIWVAGFEYPVATYQDTRLSTSGGVNHTSTQIELKSPDNTGNLFIRCDNGGDGSFTNVFYSRRQGATTGNQYNIFLDVPKTKVNSLQFTETPTASLTSLGLEYTIDTGINTLVWQGDYVLTDNEPNIINRITFDSITLTNVGLERNGTDIYWNGSKLNNQSTGSSYFTDNGITATSSALDFNFVQAVNINGTFTANSQIIGIGDGGVSGTNNMVFNLPSGTNNSYITINSGQRFINYHSNTNKGLYISHQGGSDSEHNIQFQLHASPTTFFKIDDTNSTFYTNAILDSGKNLTITSGTLSVTGDISHSTGIISANNISTSNLTVTSGSITAGNIQNTGTITNFGRIDTNGDVDLNANLIVRSQNISTNYLNVSMSDTTATYKLNGGSAPSTHVFRDYNNDNIITVARDNFRIYSSSGNTTFLMSSSNCSIYNPLDCNQIYSRSGTQLDLGNAGTSVMNISGTVSVNIPTADLFLQQGNVSTTDDSNALWLGKWRIKQRIVPNVEFQALRFEFDPSTGGKGGYILRSRNDAVITFTGQHKNSIIEEETFELEKGMLLSSTGIIKNFNVENVITISESLPILKPTEKAKDKAVYGVWTGDKKKVNEYIQGSFGTTCEPLEEDNSRCIVNSTGEGAILVCNEGGNIEIGDYICSSNKKGLGMRQDDDINRNYTIAKATTAHIFTNDNEKVLIACLYML